MTTPTPSQQKPLLKPTLGRGPQNWQWYTRLKKSPLNPPQWVFPIVWTILYILIATSFFLYLKATAFEYTYALVIFAIQLVFNLAWSPIFFVAKRIGLALVDVAFMWVSILATIVAFWQQSHVAAGLLVPYLMWVTLATHLNYYVWRYNPGYTTD